jgi:hypothetical protein
MVETLGTIHEENVEQDGYFNEFGDYFKILPFIIADMGTPRFPIILPQTTA